MIIETRGELYSYVASKTEAMQKMDVDTLEVAIMAIMEMASYLTEYEEEIKCPRYTKNAQSVLRRAFMRYADTMIRDNTEKNFDTCFKVFEACLRKVES